jgi:hypothetical protein
MQFTDCTIITLLRTHHDLRQLDGIINDQGDLEEVLVSRPGWMWGD